MTYALYPSVDEEYNFPPEIRQAIANSPELATVIQSIIDELPAQEVSNRTFLPGTIITNNNWGIGKSQMADIQSKIGTSLSRHDVAIASGDIRLIYTNTAMTTETTEDGGAADILLRVSVQKQGFPLKRVTFNGVASLNLQPGGIAISDPIGFELTAGETLLVRSYVNASQWYPVLCRHATSDGTVVGGYGSGDLTSGGAINTTNSSWLFGPAAIVGRPIDPSAKSYVIVGDGSAGGAGDGDGVHSAFTALGAPSGGYISRALTQQGHGWINLASVNDTAGGWNDPNLNHVRRIVLVHGADKAISGYGSQDINNGRTLENIKASLLSLWSTLKDRGLLVYQTTVIPHTMSTDGWATVGNQYKYTNGTEENRIALNAWIRTTPGLLSGYFDAADIAETSRNSGIWKAGYTSDGTYPNSTGHLAMAESIVF